MLFLTSLAYFPVHGVMVMILQCVKYSRKGERALPKNAEMTFQFVMVRLASSVSFLCVDERLR